MTQTKTLGCEVLVVLGPNKGQSATGTAAGYNRHRKANEKACDACREANAARVRGWYAANPGKAAASTAKYRDANPDKIREIEANYWSKNHDKKLAKNARYRETHREELSLKAAKYVQQRRARKLNAPIGIAYEREDIFQRDTWTCQICQEPIDEQASWPDPMSKSIDHIVELFNGGADCETNVRATHLTCNLSRSRT